MTQPEPPQAPQEWYEAWCMKCKCVQPFLGIVTKVKRGRMAKGQCDGCGGNVCRSLKNEEPSGVSA